MAASLRRFAWVVTRPLALDSPFLDGAPGPGLLFRLHPVVSGSLRYKHIAVVFMDPGLFAVQRLRDLQRAASRTYGTDVATTAQDKTIKM